MKQARLILTALLALAGLGTAWAATVSPYTVDFDTPILTSAHDFRVASNWKHIVHRYNDGYFDYYMSYTYGSDTGIGGTGALYAGQQQAGDNWDNETTYDLLVTPVVSGTVTVYAKKSSYGSQPFVELWSLNAGGTARSERLHRADLTGNDWVAVSYTLSTPQRIGIRAQYAYLDNFSATQAEIETERSIRVVTAEPSQTTGTIYWNQQANGKVLVKYTVTVTNNGETALAPGEAGYSVSIFNRATGTVYGTTAVPQALAVGATSQPFDVTAELDPSVWPSSYQYIHMDLRENLQGSETQRAQSHYTEYAPKLVFRAEGSDSKTSLTGEQAYGMVTATTTQRYELYNGGNAPLTVRSITLPEGFTSADMPATPFTLEQQKAQPLAVTLPADTKGSYSGQLQIVYLGKGGAEQTYLLSFSGNVVGANTWTATFDSKESDPLYPQGSVAEAGITSGYTYSSGNYNHYLKSYTSNSFANENNRFITPLLRAQAGEKLAFQVARDQQGEAYGMKVYLSTDRQTWGNPVLTLSAANLTDDFAEHSITLPKAGNYYVAFALYGVRLDNLFGLEQVAVPHDAYITEMRQDDEVQTGQTISPRLSFIPLTDEAAGSYTVAYYVDGQQVAQAEAVALTASAKMSKSFTFSYTPTDAVTTTHQTRATVTFSDGTAISTPERTLRVVADPYFSFISTDAYITNWSAPSSITTTVDFGRTNQTTLTRQFRIYNWGQAPLTITSLSASQGFTATVTKDDKPFDLATQTIASKDSVTVTVGFAPTVAGTYSGKLTVVHNGLGTASPYELALTGTMLDASLWYADFGTENDGPLPLGALAQQNVSVSTPVAGDACLQSASEQKNLFITPKMTVKQGDRLTFDYKPRSNSVTGEKAGYVRVYLVSDHVAAALTETDDELMALSPVLATGGNVAVDYAVSGGEWATHIVPMPRSGDYYVALKICDAYVDNIYGLTPAAGTAHEWLLGAVGMPTEAMQNVPAQAAISLHNIGRQTETDYTVTAYVDGQATTTAATTPLPVAGRLSETPATVMATFRSPRPGTFPVYFALRAGDYELTTQPVNVTFAPEQALSELTVGTKTTTSNAVPFYTSWMDDATGVSASDVLYTAEQLAAAGLTPGSKITAITFTGMANTTKTIGQLKAEAWVGLQQAGTFQAGNADKGTLQHVVVYNDETVVFTSGKPHTFRIALAEPIVYDGTSALRLFTNINGHGTYVSVTFDVDGNYANAYYVHGTESYSAAPGTPVALLSVAAESALLSGRVTDKQSGQPIAGATIELVSQDNDRVGYQATTDPTGRYVVSVIQSLRSYTVSATAKGYAADRRTIDMGGQSQTIDFQLSSGTQPGDVNGDGLVNVTDVTATINIILGKAEDGPTDRDAADMDGNGIINVSDVTAIINLILGK